MHIGLIAPPFIEVPPLRYGGTELFVAHLAEGLEERGHEVTVYANGESRPGGRLKWRYPRSEWPIADPVRCQLKNADHLGWAGSSKLTGALTGNAALRVNRWGAG